ncbi:unnamed protein product [Phytophthora fragariaefolia]|uniref:Unnamed protein product n=1 Tax=Phytophthora fragariaefolia TaxID=1490495 RepID=A0A9W6WYL8_9STRA|nr:unnamed protein product [Phytophthora fragariaefolia]
MYEPETLLAMAVHLKTRDRLASALKVLRRKLHEEKAQDVRRRSLRVRHYATLDCIPDPQDSDWMTLWKNGTDENFIHYTSLDRYGRVYYSCCHNELMLYLSVVLPFAVFWSISRPSTSCRVTAIKEVDLLVYALNIRRSQSF